MHLPIYLIKHIKSGHYAHIISGMTFLRHVAIGSIAFYNQGDADRACEKVKDCHVEKIFNTAVEVAYGELHFIIEYQVGINAHRYTVGGYTAARAFADKWQGRLLPAISPSLNLQPGQIHAHEYNAEQAYPTV